eukprot:NODE_5120_length_717_cov_22.456587_g4753_i0.p1 GENE.NODE_5120_length_717_cov_22.456587_g4753_i0~~NODE_5120_length_717_cov_22.456587_g4753_i0.p1  ORF type:complete len:183 (+),score=18.17 NODE_5120_length_717_cov_22.456587_g4753_i0:128-676(+)
MSHYFSSPTPFKKWKRNEKGHICDFSLTELRADMVLRLRTPDVRYTLEECKILLQEILRTTVATAQRELAHLLRLSQLRDRLLPEQPIAYKAPPSMMPQIEWATGVHRPASTPEHRLRNMVDDVCLAVVRVIDTACEERRQRLLLAAHVLSEIAPLTNQRHGDAATTSNPIDPSLAALSTPS